MENKAADLIKEIKAIKEENDITYAEIMDQMEALNSRFEEILLPIYNAMMELNKQPRTESVHEMQIKALKSVLRVQAEEIDRMMELNSHLQARVEFLVGQVDKKDALIQKLMERAL